MPEIEITIGGRQFEVACAEGEEHYLLSAARMLDAEATVLTEQIGRIPEPRMLLMAGLMLADRTAGVEDKLRELDDELGRLRAEMEKLRASKQEPRKVEVPVIPTHMNETLGDLAAQIEAMAEMLEDKARAG
ncbi:cell division protein ZapA [Oceanicola sp. 22II-s10i]|uniref:cell division protein ZapA n=1 Tax=Oceanicola sp. 22II-s10i TaxID=1317116 RepID=UPI000B521247|nr:cell division protein ZapA [Oceanicola sp. 22II-s10i]OWU83868.1 cell division protein ZapA [Oceanicola sp. 22II-s10i]